MQTTDHDKANTLNNHFKSDFTNEQLPIPSKVPSQFPTIQTLDIGVNGVRKQLEALKPHKATDPDEIPARVLKETAREISTIVQHIFKHSYTTGKLPQAWTTALVTPIYKKGNKSNPANYRPIPLTCILCKVMEHIVLSMWKHLNANYVVLHHQHGFQTGLSCQTQLVEAVHDWASSMKNKKQTDILLLDFSKALDTGPHKRLLNKVNQYGITRPTLQWINCFLSNRTQTVSVNGLIILC